MQPMACRRILGWCVGEGVWTAIITGICGLIGAYLGAYVKRKAENLAAREGFSEILNQIKVQTSETEQIKSKISHANWTSQEWKTVRRTKLEDLLNCVCELRQQAVKDVHKLSDDSISGRIFDTEPNAILKIEVLWLLYFPELKIAAMETVLNFRVFQDAIEKCKKENKEDTANLIKLHEDFALATRKLCKDSENLIIEIMGVSQP